MSPKLSTEASDRSQGLAGPGGPVREAWGAESRSSRVGSAAALTWADSWNHINVEIPNAYLRVCSFLPGNIEAVNEETPGPALNEHVLVRRRARRFMSVGLSPLLRQG